MTSHHWINRNTQICNLHNFIPEKALRKSFSCALTKALALWFSGGNTFQTPYSNKRTIKARHCGLWLQLTAHAVLTTKKQAELFAESSLIALKAKMSTIPLTYCHKSWLISAFSFFCHIPEILGYFLNLTSDLPPGGVFWSKTYRHIIVSLISITMCPNCSKRDDQEIQ